MSRATQIECAEAHSAVWAAVGRKSWLPEIYVDWRWAPAVCAVFAGHWTHLTQAFALTRRIGNPELDAVERLHGSLLALPTIHVSSVFDRSIASVENRGLRLLGTSDVLARPARERKAPERASDIRVAPVSRNNASDWIRAVSAGCLEKDTASEAELEIGGIVSRMPHTTLFTAGSHGAAAGGGALYVHDATGILFCDATLPLYRGRGVQTALIRERVRFAEKLGCELVTATVQAGTASARNYERCGFRKLYSRLTFQRR